MSEGPGGLLLVMMEVDREYEDEFNRWFDEEHLPERLGCPGFLSGRRYRVVDGEPTYLAIYELESTEVLESDAYRQMLPPSAWMQRVSPGFTKIVRNVYVEITPDIVPGQGVDVVR
jgi:hypothetical protein